MSSFRTSGMYSELLNKKKFLKLAHIWCKRINKWSFKSKQNEIISLLFKPIYISISIKNLPEKLKRSTFENIPSNKTFWCFYCHNYENILSKNIEKTILLLNLIMLCVRHFHNYKDCFPFSLFFLVIIYSNIDPWIISHVTSIVNYLI